MSRSKNSVTASSTCLTAILARLQTTSWLMSPVSALKQTCTDTRLLLSKLDFRVISGTLLNRLGAAITPDHSI